MALRVVVLGAAGFIGSEVLRQVRACEDLRGIGVGRGAEVDVVVDLASTPMDKLERVFRDCAPDVVLNCAGATHGDPDDLVRGNVTAVQRMLRAIQNLSRPPRLIHLGSAAEYGGTKTDDPIAESRRPTPGGAYGLTKLAGTQLVLDATQDGLDAVVLRAFNLSGPGSPDSTLLGRVVHRLRAGDDVVRLGSLDAWRDYVDVRDVAQAVVRAATRPTPAILNLGSGTAVHARAIVQRLVQLSNTGARVIEAPGGEGNHAGSPAAAVRWQRADTTNTSRALDWSPSIDLDTSLRDTWTARQPRPR